MKKLEEKDRSEKPIVYTLHLMLATYRSSSFFPFSHTFHPSPLYTLLPYLPAPQSFVILSSLLQKES